MELHFATSNMGKVQSFQRDLSGYDITVVHDSIDLAEPRSSDVQEIAIAKINEAYSKIGKPVAAMDAGFYIHSLAGFPRAYVNFMLDTIGVEGILKLLNGEPRECEFQECLAYIDETLEEPKCFLVHIKGTISNEIRGSMQDHHWSRLSLIFIPEGYDKTLAEMSRDEYVGWAKTSKEKHSVGHKLGEWISQRDKVEE